MIFCGYAGVGKSTAAKLIKGVVDLESTPFQKDWVTYARVAKHMSDNGYIVLVSCHKELREELHRIGALYAVVFPDKTKHRQEYKIRYERRGNTPEFIKTQMDNWDEWVGDVLSWEDENGEKIYEYSVYLDTTPSGKIETISDFLDDVLQYGPKIFDLLQPIEY